MQAAADYILDIAGSAEGAVVNIPIKDAKEMFEDLVRRAEAGEHVVVTRDGRPVAEIVSAPEKNSLVPEFGSLPRVGAFRDEKLWIAPDFDELGPEWDDYIK
jgi:prevent-host-death family protein